MERFLFDPSVSQEVSSDPSLNVQQEINRRNRKEQLALFMRFAACNTETDR